MLLYIMNTFRLISKGEIASPAKKEIFKYVDQIILCLLGVQKFSAILKV